MSNCKHENRTIDCVCNDCGYDLIVDPMAEKYAALERERIIKLLETKHFPESSMHSNRCSICKAVALITGEADYYEEETDWLDALIKGENK